MAKKSKASSARRPAPSAALDDGQEITDARFAAASTRPQFAKARVGPGTAGDDDDGSREGGALLAGNSASASGLGASLAAAIASDDRFAAALDSDKFGCVPRRDKYGRKTKKGRKKKDDDGGNYDFGDEDEDEEHVEGEAEDGKKKSQKEKDKEADNDDADTSMEARIAYLNALSRGDISASSSSSSDGSSSDSDDDDARSDDDDASAASPTVHGAPGIFDPSHTPLPGDIPPSEEELTHDPSPYLCLLNLNWEHTRAVDVYAMLHSFCPPGTLRKVEVYPSDFGRERMARERREGPTGLWKGDTLGKKEEDDGEDSSKGSDDDDSDDEEGENDDDSDTDDDEDALTLADATAKLYAHFPPQSSVMKNSQLTTEEEEEEGFDLEKLRAYEASKLRYYFAVATFATSAAAEAVYENVDGMEMEHSAAEVDVRVLPKDQYQSTIEGRELRDVCDQLPAKYAPPEDNVATALRQSRVTCSWERGDAAREKVLTRYGMGKDAWEALAEGDDIKFYLATSDASSGEEGSESEAEEEERGGAEKKKKRKAAGMRAMLGLAASDESEGGLGVSEDSSSGSESGSEEGDGAIANEQPAKASSPTDSESESEEDEDDADAKEATFTPGKRALEEKIRSKLHSKQAGSNGEGAGGEGTTEATPFEKYLEKRRQKRRERRRAARNARKDRAAGVEEAADGGGVGEDDDGMYEADPEFGVARFSDEGSEDEDADGGEEGTDDGFFLGETLSKKGKGRKNQPNESTEERDGDNKAASTKEELALLIAGDDIEEHAKDYDMRGLAKLERHAHKKLRGKRKRQMEALAANVSGREFRIDAADDRFAALLDGDDERFGIDKMNPAYRETGAMKELLREQTKRRRKGRGQGTPAEKTSTKAEEKERGDGGGWVESGSGAMELSKLVTSLKQKTKGVEGKKKRKKAKSLQ